MISKNISEVFDFFSKPENLSTITPPKMNFHILTPSPINMKKGALIDYTINIMFISMRWRTLITKYDYPNLFVDQQIKGPYSFWHHTHTFKTKGSGTIITDKLIYGIPFGLVGRLMNFIYIQHDIKNIFQYRHKILNDIFSKIKHQSGDVI